MPNEQKEITEAQAWRIVAEEFAANRTAKFLCLALKNYYTPASERVEQIPAALRYQMRGFIKTLLDGAMFAYDNDSSDEKGSENFEARLTALCLFAAMAQDGATNV